MQSEAGVTGFYAGTGYLAGLQILLQGGWAQTPLYALAVPMLALGLWRALRRELWIWPLLIWGITHIVAYLGLGVAPYFWYYVPLAPAVAWLLALGAATSARWLSDRTRLSGSAGMAVVITIALVPLAISLSSIRQGLTGSLPPPTLPLSKVLPEAKVNSYRQAGQWLAGHTPAAADVGMTEIGVMGYYSRRPIVDFLGLLQPDAAEAISRGDPLWTLYAYQPDYLALTALSPLYSQDPRAEDWFRDAYRAVQRFDDPRFWGSPLVLYQRQTARAEIPAALVPAMGAPFPVRFGDAITLMGIEPLSLHLSSGEAANIKLWWRAGAHEATPVAAPPYRVSVQLLGQHDLVIAQQDSTPGWNDVPIASWPRGKNVPDLALIGVPSTACTPDHGVLNIALYDPATGERLPATDATGKPLGDSLRVGAFALIGTGGAPVAAFANGLELTSYELEPRMAAPGASIRLVLQWRAAGAFPADLSVFVHLIDDVSGERIAQADGPPDLTGPDIRILYLPDTAAAGGYHPVIGLYRPATGERLPLVDAVGQPLSDTLTLCPVRIQG